MENNDDVLMDNENIDEIVNTQYNTFFFLNYSTSIHHNSQEDITSIYNMLYDNSGNIIPPNTIADSDDADFVNCFFVLNRCNLQKYLLEYFDKSIVENNNIIKKIQKKIFKQRLEIQAYDLSQETIGAVGGGAIGDGVVGDGGVGDGVVGDGAIVDDDTINDMIDNLITLQLELRHNKRIRRYIYAGRLTHRNLFSQYSIILWDIHQYNIRILCDFFNIHCVGLQEYIAEFICF